MTEYVDNSTVVLLTDGQPVGSAFLVDPSGLLVTCEHIVRDMSPGQIVEFETLKMLGREKGTAKVTRHKNVANDAALLEIMSPLTKKLMPVRLIRSDAAQGVDFTLVGYGEVPDHNAIYDYYRASGGVEGIVSRNDVDFLKLHSSGLLIGMSGSAIYCPHLGGVVGMQCERLNIDQKGSVWGRDTGFACTSEAIATLLPKQLCVEEAKRETLFTGIDIGNFTATGSIVVQTNYIGDFGLKEAWRAPAESAPGLDWRNVVPRNKELQVLAEKLRPECPIRMLAIWGMAGTGKTTIAANFVERYTKDYSGGVLWAELGAHFVPERSVQVIFQRWASWGYPDLASFSRWQAQQPLHVRAEDIKRVLSGRGPMLVVFDDVRDYAHIELLRNAVPNEASILVTALEQPQGKHADQFPAHSIGPLSEDEGIEFLKQRVPELSTEVRRKLAKSFGYPAQALALVASDLKQRTEPESHALSLLQEGTQGKPLEPIRLALDSSYAALTDEDQRSRFRMLGVLTDFGVNTDFSVDMAAALWAQPRSSAKNTLESLRSRALVKELETDRWSMEALVGDHAHALMQKETAERDAASMRYRTYFIELGRQAAAWARDNPDIPLLLSVGEALIADAERALGRDLQGLAIEALDNLPDTLQEPLLESAMFIRNSFGYLLQGVKADAFARRWLGAYIGIVQALSNQEATAEGLYVLAQLCLAQDNIPEAIELFERQKQVAEACDNVHLQGLALHGEASALALQGREPKKAIAVFRDALVRLDQYKSSDQELRLHLLIGLIGAYLSINEHQDARAVLSEAAQLAEDASDPDISLRIDMQLGVLDLFQDNADDALHRFQQAQRHAQACNDKRTVAELAVLIGSAYLYSGNHPRADEQFSQALQSAEEIPFPRLKPRALAKVAQLQYAQGDLDEALKHSQEALGLAKIHEDETLQAQLHALLGDVLNNLGKPDEALQELRASFDLLSKVQDTTTAVNVLNTMGAIYQKTKQIKEGVEFLKDALDVIKTRNNAGAESIILNWLSMLLNEAGNAPEALDYFEQAQPLIDRLDNNAEKASVFAVQALVYMYTGRLDEAYTVLSEVERAWRSMNDGVRHSETLILLAQVSLGQQKLDQAQRHVEQLEKLVNTMKNTPIAAAYFNLRGILRLNAEEYDQAEIDLQHASQINDQIEDLAQQFTNLFYRALLHLARQELDPAREYLDRALAVAEQCELIPNIATVHATLGLLHYTRGDLAGAADAMEEAAQTLEEAGIDTDSENRGAAMFRDASNAMRNAGSDTIPEESLQILLKATNWDELKFVIQTREEALCNPHIDDILAQTIEAAARAHSTFLDRVLVCYQRILTVCRDKGAGAVYEAWHEIGTAALEQWWAYQQRINRNYSAALTHVNRVLDLDQNDTDALLERAWVQRGMGRNVEALTDFAQVISLKAIDHLAYQGKGVIEFERGQLSLAVASLTKAIQLQDNDAYSYQWRGAVFQEQRLLDIALLDLEKATQLEPETSDHHYWKALLLLDNNETTQAKGELTKAIRFDENQEAQRSLSLDYFWRGVAQDLLGEKLEASVDWDKVGEFVDENPEDWSVPLYTISGEGKVESARSQYQALLRRPYAPHILTEQLRHLRLLARLYPNQSAYLDFGGILEHEIQRLAMQRIDTSDPSRAPEGKSMSRSGVNECGLGAD